MKVILTRRAQREQDAIFEFIAERSKSGARRVAAAIERTLVLIGDQPDIGARTRRAEVLSIPLALFPYRIFYRRTEDRILVIHIRHAARRPWTG